MLLIISILTLIIVICHFLTIFTWRKPVPAMPHWFVFAPDGFSKHPMLARLTLSCLSLLMPIEEGTIILLHHKKSPRHISLAFSAVMIVSTASAASFILVHSPYLLRSIASLSSYVISLVMAVRLNISRFSSMLRFGLMLKRPSAHSSSNVFSFSFSISQ